MRGWHSNLSLLQQRARSWRSGSDAMLRPSLLQRGIVDLPSRTFLEQLRSPSQISVGPITPQTWDFSISNDVRNNNSSSGEGRKYQLPREALDRP